MNDLHELLKIAIQASIEAGLKISDIYRQDFEVEFKEDNSPLTTADKASHEVIIKHLDKTGIPVLSEEGKSISYEERKIWKHLWIVDPLDGTREFLKRNGEFTVNIALVHEQIPVLGVIYIPELKTLYYAAEGIGSWRVEAVNDPGLSFKLLEAKATRLPEKPTGRPFTVVGSKSHLTPETQTYIDEITAGKENFEVKSKGSSLKICMVAEGKADIYPRFAPTMEWDVAAGHAIARFAGFTIHHHNKVSELSYNKESLVNPWFIVEKKAESGS